MLDIVFAINNSDDQEVFNHLAFCDRQFTPLLSSKVDISAYSKKITDKAIRFEAWNQGRLIGLIAIYRNDKTNGLFITNVSVEKDFLGMGIAGTIMKNVITFGMEHKLQTIRLEVNKLNSTALALYYKFDFKLESEENETLYLIYHFNYGK
ncbi:MAG: GNAT family N-acetyltransferase [Chitinophagaceae bacterium]